jgi:hypothetical protein
MNWQLYSRFRFQCPTALLPEGDGDFMRSVLLWALGVPLPIIIILWLFTGHA